MPQEPLRRREHNLGDAAIVSKEPLTFSWKKLTITQAFETGGAECAEPRISAQ